MIPVSRLKKTVSDIKCVLSLLVVFQLSKVNMSVMEEVEVRDSTCIFPVIHCNLIILHSI